MSVLLLSLLQQGRLSKVVIVGAALLFIAGVSLLVYFYRRYQRIEKDTEEDWDNSLHSLFVNAPPSPPSSPKMAEEAEDKGVVPVAPTAEITPVVSGGTASPSEPIGVIEPAAPPVEPIGPIGQIGSIVQKEKTESEHAAFDEDIWAGLEAEEQSRTQGGETAPLHALTERLPGARVDERSHREPFEPPSIERALNREPYEPPRIQPLTPREQAVTRELRSSPPPPTQAARDESKERPARDTVIFGTKPAERDAHPLTTEPPAAEPMVAASGRIAEPSLGGARSYRAPAGSVLGLPAEASRGPLILGQSARAESETGIGALTNYGKDLSPKAGFGGTIALLIVVILLGGSLLLYLFVPSVHSRVGAFVGRVRGTDPQASTKSKVQVFPAFRQEVNKNIVTAKGAIDNISDEPLENLEVEVSLQRGADTPPEIRRIAVAPNPLPPNARGTFEFDYDGKRDTGFVSGKITRVFSNGSEIKFRAPNQP
jgi:hypothetical protein